MLSNHDSQTTGSAKCLRRPYSTIGIENVFLEPPPHPFPSDYLKDGGDGTSFASWEILGTIKKSPEDFCVREISQRDRRIPGLSDDDHEKLRIANIMSLQELPQQNLAACQPSTTNDAPTSRTETKPATSVLDLGQNVKVTPRETIMEYLQKVTEHIQTSESSAEDLMRSLDDMSSFASERVEKLSLLSETKILDPVFIPPLPQDDEDCSPASLRQARGAFHRALKSIFPLLDSNNFTRNEVSHWIEIKVDETYDDITLEDGTKTRGISVNRDKKGMSRKRKRQSGTDERNFDPYPNVLIVLKKRQKEHLTAIQKLCRVLKCRESDLGMAGIKDLQAITYQFCTIRNGNPNRLQSRCGQLETYGLDLSHFYRVDWMLNNGDLEGNQFTLVIRNLKRLCINENGEESLAVCEEKHFLEMFERLKRSGFINFYGEQRVGSAGLKEEVGVRAFDIGRAMLRQDFAAAIDLIMTGRSPEYSRESDSAKKIRQTWKETSGDETATLKAFQGADNVMSRERIILKGLKRHGNAYPLEALRCLSHGVRMFWINAYQSYVWNQVASARIQRYGKKAVKGDLYQEVPNGKILVVASEESSVPLASVVLPLPGFNVQYPENDIGELYSQLLQKDGVEFKKDAPAESTAKGTYRSLVVQPMGLEAEMESSNGTDIDAKLTFELPKGCYATIFLRELMLTTGARLHFY